MRNICCYYTSSCIMRNTLSCIREINIVIIHRLVPKIFVVINIFLYNRNKYCYYTRRYIITIFISVIYLLV